MDQRFSLWRPKLRSMSKHSVELGLAYDNYRLRDKFYKLILYWTMHDDTNLFSAKEYA